MDKYKLFQWKEYRQTIIKRDNFACVKCGRELSEGAILQVHHKYYMPDKKIWEYPLDACITVCKNCHAMEHNKILPNNSWELLNFDDLGSLDGVCEYCGTELRYEFLIYHMDWGELRVGTICCDKLTATEKASNFMKSRIKEQNFIDSTKRKTENGKLIIKYKDRQIEIVKTKSVFKLIINGEMGKNFYPNVKEAKERAFYVIEENIR